MSKQEQLINTARARARAHTHTHTHTSMYLFLIWPDDGFKFKLIAAKFGTYRQIFVEVPSIKFHVNLFSESRANA